MTDSPDARGPRQAALPRVLALVAIALLAILAFKRLGRWEEMQRDLRATAVAAGLSGETLTRTESAMRREADPANARLALAGALLDRELLNRDPTSPASFERLRTARDLARWALAGQPSNYEAAMIVGATTSLERSRARDTRLFSLATQWERPLNVAMALAPGAEAPRRLLAAAYLEGWAVLSPAKKTVAEGLLREAFRDPSTFERLYAAWVEIAGSLERAATLLPDEPRSWRRLAETAFAKRAFLESIALTERHRRSLAAKLEADLARTEAADGEILTTAPVDAAFAPLVERALGRRPPGAASQREANAAQVWFEWATPLCLTGACPFSGNSMARLASLAGALLAPEQIAFAALAAGDEAKADLLERRSESLWSEIWAPYFTLKAKRLVESGNLAGARAALQQAHRAFRVRSVWRALAEQTSVVANDGGATGKAAPTLSDATFAAALMPAARESWEASDWWFDRGATRLDLVPARAAEALVLELAQPPAEGALLEVYWDGARLMPVWVPPGVTTVRVAPPAPTTGSAVTRELHLLEARALFGGVRPAMRVRLG